MRLGFLSLACTIFAAVVAQSLPPNCTCAGTLNNATDTTHLCGDSRLGPVYLPVISPIGAGMLYGYDRFQGVCPGEFLRAWTFPNGRYRYPEPMGFQNSTTGQAIRGFETLVNGTLVDRFGAAVNGSYLAPAYTPFQQRALPPSSLNPPKSGKAPAAEYHVYRVVKNLTVQVGTTTAWFGQPGQGTQYYLFDGNSNSTVEKLIRSGTLVEVPIQPDS